MTDLPTPTISTRDAIRSKVLGETHKPKSKVVEFFGTQVEIRQPTLGSIIEAQSSEDPKRGIIEILLNRTFVPGTDDRVFDDADEAVLRNLPFGEDLIRVSQALSELSDVNFPVQETL